MHYECNSLNLWQKQRRPKTIKAVYLLRLVSIPSEASRSRWFLKVLVDEKHTWSSQLFVDWLSIRMLCDLHPQLRDLTKGLLLQGFLSWTSYANPKLAVHFGFGKRTGFGVFVLLLWFSFLPLSAYCCWLKVQQGASFMMLHVRAALSGNPVEELHVEELKVGLQETEELRAVALKRVLAAKLGCTRFRLKLLGGDTKVIADDAPLSGPADFTLVRMDFQSSDEATNATFISACKEGRVTEVEGLLHGSQNPDARDAQDNRNGTGIYWAARNGHLRLLLEAGADKDAASNFGGTSLHVAAAEGHLDVVRLLLEARADKDATTQRGLTAVLFAAAFGHLDVAQVLLDAGVDRDAPMLTGATALHAAAAFGHLAIVRLLLQGGADKDTAIPQEGLTAMHFAAENGHLHVVRFLVESGANKDAAKQNGATALHMAARYGRLDVVRLLLQAGADKDAAMEDGTTPLQTATQNGHLEVAELLRKSHAASAARRCCCFKRARFGN